MRTFRQVINELTKQPWDDKPGDFPPVVLPPEDGDEPERPQHPHYLLTTGENGVHVAAHLPSDPRNVSQKAQDQVFQRLMYGDENPTATVFVGKEFGGIHPLHMKNIIDNLDANVKLHNEQPTVGKHLQNVLDGVNTLIGMSSKRIEADHKAYLQYSKNGRQNSGPHYVKNVFPGSEGYPDLFHPVVQALIKHNGIKKPYNFK